MNILKTKSQLNNWKEELQRSIGVRDNILKQQEELKKIEKENRKLAEKSIKALNFVEESVRNVRNKTLKSIESVTNEALQVVYDENLKLECDFGIKRDRSAVNLRYVKKIGDDQFVKRDPDGSGCGVSDVVSFALRLVLIKATNSHPILIADEPFKWIGRDQIPKAASLLKFLSHKLGIQTIITTHHKALKDVADNPIGLDIDENGVVQVISEGA